MPGEMLLGRPPRHGESGRAVSALRTLDNAAAGHRCHFACSFILAPFRLTPSYDQLKLKLTLMRSASARLGGTSWRSQLSNRITLPASAG